MCNKVSYFTVITMIIQEANTKEIVFVHSCSQREIVFVSWHLTISVKLDYILQLLYIYKKAIVKVTT